MKMIRRKKRKNMKIIRRDRETVKNMKKRNEAIDYNITTL